jgi:hypothetical protein
VCVCLELGRGKGKRKGNSLDGASHRFWRLVRSGNPPTGRLEIMFPPKSLLASEKLVVTESWENLVALALLRSAYSHDRDVNPEKASGAMLVMLL